MLGFASTCIASWEGILAYVHSIRCYTLGKPNIFSYLYFILVNGGTPLLFWGFIACAIGQTLVYASIAEMSSM
jgi:hypothetical protein